MLVLYVNELGLEHQGAFACFAAKIGEATYTYRGFFTDYSWYIDFDGLRNTAFTLSNIVPSHAFRPMSIHSDPWSPLQFTQVSRDITIHIKGDAVIALDDCDIGDKLVDYYPEFTNENPKGLKVTERKGP